MNKLLEIYNCHQCSIEIGKKSVIDHIIPGFEPTTCKLCLIKEIQDFISCYNLSLNDYVKECNKKHMNKPFCMEQVDNFELIMNFHRIIKLLDKCQECDSRERKQE